MNFSQNNGLKKVNFQPGRFGVRFFIVFIKVNFRVYLNLSSKHFFTQKCIVFLRGFLSINLYGEAEFQPLTKAVNNKRVRRVTEYRHYFFN